MAQVARDGVGDYLTQMVMFSMFPTVVKPRSRGICLIVFFVCFSDSAWAMPTWLCRILVDEAVSDNAFLEAAEVKNVNAQISSPIGLDTWGRLKSAYGDFSLLALNSPNISIRARAWATLFASANRTFESSFRLLSEQEISLIRKAVDFSIVMGSSFNWDQPDFFDHFRIRGKIGDPEIEFLILRGPSSYSYYFKVIKDKNSASDYALYERRGAGFISESFFDYRRHELSSSSIELYESELSGVLPGTFLVPTFLNQSMEDIARTVIASDVHFIGFPEDTSTVEIDNGTMFGAGVPAHDVQHITQIRRKIESLKPGERVRLQGKVNAVLDNPRLDPDVRTGYVDVVFHYGHEDDYDEVFAFDRPSVRRYFAEQKNWKADAHRYIFPRCKPGDFGPCTSSGLKQGIELFEKVLLEWIAEWDQQSFATPRQG